MLYVISNKAVPVRQILIDGKIHREGFLDWDERVFFFYVHYKLKSPALIRSDVSRQGHPFLKSTLVLSTPHHGNGFLFWKQIGNRSVERYGIQHRAFGVPAYSGKLSSDSPETKKVAASCFQSWQRQH